MKIENKSSFIGNCLLLFVVGVLVISSVNSMYYTMKVVRSYGMVKGINLDVYFDSDLSLPASVIDWGAFERGETKTRALYLVSYSNVPIMVNMSVVDMVPSEASNFIFLVWDCEGWLLMPEVVLCANLSLIVSGLIPGNITSFSFDIHLIGSG